VKSLKILFTTIVLTENISENHFLGFTTRKLEDREWDHHSKLLRFLINRCNSEAEEVKFKINNM
jgi:hypothetical protein